MDWIGWILLRSLVQLEHLAVLITSLIREAFGFICRDQATTGFLGYIFKFVLIQRIAMIASLDPGLHLQVLKLWGGGGHHDVPEGVLHRGSRGDQERICCQRSCGAVRRLSPGLLKSTSLCCT